MEPASFNNSGGGQECVLVTTLAESVSVKVVLSIKVVLLWIGVGILYLEHFAKIEGKKITFHPNSLVIFNFIRFFLFWISMGYIIIHTFDLYRLSYSFESPCSRLVRVWIVTALRFNTTICTVALIAANQILGLERIFCTWKVYDYEQSTKPAKSSLSCSLWFVWSCSQELIQYIDINRFQTICYSTIAYWSMFTSMSQNNLLALTSARNAVNNASYNAFTYFLMVSSVINLVLFMSIQIWNRHLSRKVVPLTRQDNSLSVKFQLKETIKIMDCFLPYLLGQVCLYLMTTVGGILAPLMAPQLHQPAKFITINEAVFVTFGSAHVFGLVMMYKTGKLGVFFCHRSPRRLAAEQLKIHATETNSEFYKRQDAMFGTIFNYDEIFST